MSHFPLYFLFVEYKSGSLVHITAKYFMCLAALPSVLYLVSWFCFQVHGFDLLPVYLDGPIWICSPACVNFHFYNKPPAHGFVSLSLCVSSPRYKRTKGKFVYLILRLICQSRECGLETHPPTTCSPKQCLGYIANYPHFRLFDGNVHHVCFTELHIIFLMHVTFYQLLAIKKREGV